MESFIDPVDNYGKIEKNSKDSNKKNDQSAEMINKLNEYKEKVSKIKEIIKLTFRFVKGRQILFEKLNNEFSAIEIEIEDLLHRFTKSSYEIAVMGLEKSGKTSLVNAILGINLLPTKRERCTYVPTELRSCASADERMEIEYLSVEEFNQHKDAVKKGLNIGQSLYDQDRIYHETLDHGEPAQLTKSESRKIDLNHKENKEILNEEYKEILEVEEKAKSYLGKNKETVINDKSRNFEDHVLKIVSLPEVARAVKRVILFTNNLKLGNDDSEVSLFDIPGYDSPIAIHKKQAEDNASKSDAIIFVKKFESPSIKQGENELLNMFENNAGCISMKEKLIVAISSIDVATTKKDFKDNFDLIRTNFEKKNIKSPRIFPVCSAAKYLDPGNTTNEESKQLAKQAKEKLKILSLTDGIDELKDFIKKFVNDYRFKNLAKSFYKTEVQFKEQIKIYLETCKSEFNIENFQQELIEESFDDQKEQHKFDWWASFWPATYKKYQTFYTKEILSISDPDILNQCPEFLSDFKLKYDEIVDCMESEIEEWFNKQANEIWVTQAYNHAYIAPSQAHTAIRIELAEETFRKVSELLTKNLCENIWKTIKKMLDFIMQEMFFIDGIISSLMKNSECNYKNIINEKIEILILRLVRPSIDLFLRFPRDDNRIHTIEIYKNEVIILDMFYKEENIKKRGLPFYLSSGKYPENINEKITLEFEISDLKEGEKCYTLPSSKDQIKQDIKEFFKYVKHSIYYASGIEAFFRQELDKIGFQFNTQQKNHGKWEFLVFKSIKNGNPKITNEIMEQFEFDSSKKKTLFQSIKEVDLFYKNNF